jgi:hypothetical protein
VETEVDDEKEEEEDEEEDEVEEEVVAVEEEERGVGEGGERGCWSEFFSSSRNTEWRVRDGAEDDEVTAEEE